MDADICVQKYEDKLKKLLDKFLDPDFEIKNDTYLNILLSHLSGKNNEELGKALLKLPIVVEWLFKAIKHWEDTASLPSPTIVTFVAHLAALLSKDEANFVSFNSCNVYIRLCSTLKFRTSDISPSIKLAYIKLLSSFLEHKSGTEWLIATNNWKDVLTFCLEGQTIYIVREGYNFMYNLLVQANYNSVFCNMVIEKIMETFNNMNFTTDSIVPEVNEEHLQKQLTPTLRLISYILESCLKSDSFTKRDYTVPTIFLMNFHLEQNIWNVIMIGSQNEELLCDLNKIMVLINFFGLAIDSETDLFQYKDIKKMVENIFKLIKMHIAKGAALNIFKMCVLLQYYWKLINSRLPKPDNESVAPLRFENQILMFQLVPVFVVAFEKFGTTVDSCDEDLFREHFITQLFKIMCEHTIRMAYSFRTLLSNQKDCFEKAQKAIMYLMLSRQYYSRDQAVIVFQSLMYAFKDGINLMKAKPEIVDVFAKQVSYFSTHLDAVATYIKEFDITWRESVETICVMGLCMDFIAYPNWPSKLIVQVLKLVNLSIARFMSPNLALLVDRTSDSSMGSLGTMLIQKLHDKEWEVRDGALEVLHTISSIAHRKFPSFQCMVLKSQLPSFTVTMCMHDSESFVRASALKCLQEMIKVPAFWNEDLGQQNLLQKMIQIILNETEAIVRCEAAILIYQIFEHRSIPETLIAEVNRAMAYAATSDLHWEVKSNALCYWGKVIKCRLTNQGMIDGTFPSVTFSKENRKIVSLTKVEIQARLNKVLMELSVCGCLGVLVTAIRDDCDIEVSKKAVKITKSLTNHLNLYNIVGNVSADMALSPEVDVNSFNLPSTHYSEDIVSDILQRKDIFLLSDIGVTDNINYTTLNGLKNDLKVVTATEFLNFVQQDLDKIIAERTKWLNEIDNLESLLDDILKTYTEDVNTMDCY